MLLAEDKGSGERFPSGGRQEKLSPGAQQQKESLNTVDLVIQVGVHFYVHNYVIDKMEQLSPTLSVSTP